MRVQYPIYSERNRDLDVTPYAKGPVLNEVTEGIQFNPNRRNVDSRLRVLAKSIVFSYWKRLSDITISSR
jgi:hypothetical protein